MISYIYHHKKNSKRKFFLFLFLLFSWIDAALALTIADFDPIDPPGYLPGLIVWLFIYAIIIGALILVTILIIAGLTYLTSIGHPERMKNALSQIRSGLLGIGLILLAVLILYTINPELIQPHPTLPPTPVFVMPAPDPPPEIEPPFLDLGAVTYIGASPNEEQESILLVAVEKPFYIRGKFRGSIRSCRSLGVTSRHPIDIRIKPDPRNIDEDFFEVWKSKGEDQWWGWRLEHNPYTNFWGGIPGSGLWGPMYYAKYWDRILFYQNHLRIEEAVITKIIDRYSKEPPEVFFGNIPYWQGLRTEWDYAAIFGGIIHEEQLIYINQKYPRIPYRPYIWAGAIYHYVFHSKFPNPIPIPLVENLRDGVRENRPYEVVFADAVTWGENTWDSEIPAFYPYLSMRFDLPGLYTFRASCQGPGGIAEGEVTVAVFDPPNITITTPTFTAYTKQKIPVHIGAINAKECFIEKPPGDMKERLARWFRALKDILGDDYALKDVLMAYVFKTDYVTFDSPGWHEIKVRCEGPGGEKTKSIWVEVLCGLKSPATP